MVRNELSKKGAVLTAFAVTTIWSTSWVLIKIGLKEIPALPFASLRYFLAFLLLLPWLLRKNTFRIILALSIKDWIILGGLGLVTYTFCQGGLYLAISYLPNTTVSLILNFTPVLVAFAGGFWLGEKLSLWQYAGLVILITGAVIFFFPVPSGSLPVLGLVFTGLTLLFNVASSLYSRKLLRNGAYPVIIITGVCMGIGSTAMALGSSAWRWLPGLSLQNWIIIFFLAATNTALAFTLWNKALQKLTAFESNIISNTMLVQIAIFSYFFLGDEITIKMALGMALVIWAARCWSISEAIFDQRPNSDKGITDMDLFTLGIITRIECDGNFKYSEIPL